jgi:uncharacterized protein (DUF433 family)
MPTLPTVIDRGRGPEIAGTRITVYDILDYTTENWHPNSIALLFGLSTDQVLAAIRYIEEHKEEVMANYQKILERDAKGNPPELQARLDAGHAEFMKMMEERWKAKGLPPYAERNSTGH